MSPHPTQIPSPLSPSRFLGKNASCIGLGACLERGQEQPDALATAIAAGCNVVDTAPHYHRGDHERYVGEALTRLGANTGEQREQLIVNSQVGRIPELIESTTRTVGFGKLHTLVCERFIQPGVFEWKDLSDSDHTLAPNYLRLSIQQTLSRTNLDYLDCLFVDSPQAQRKSVPATEYQRRLRTAVETLEEACARGSIRAYGISTADAASLQDMLEAADAVAGTHAHLAALRVPFSLLRPSTYPLIQRAGTRGLYVFAVGCLDGGAPQYQLPESLIAHVGSRSDADAALQWALSAPHVGTAVIGSRDPRHIGQNVHAAGLPRLDPQLYSSQAAVNS